MIVNSERALALYCPACQGIQDHVFSIFEISKYPRHLQCSCGFVQGHIRHLEKHYELDLLSVAGDRIRLLYSLREFLFLPLVAILEPQSGQEVGYLGHPYEVEEAAFLLGDEWEYSDVQIDLDEFVNPQVMHRVLEKLQELAENDRIKCGCEHPSVGVDIYADKVELVCSFCGSAVLIGGTTRKDQERIARITEIVMEPSSHAFLEERLKPLV